MSFRITPILLLCTGLAAQRQFADLSKDDFPTAFAYAHAVGDFDRDGDADVIALSGSNVSVFLLQNDGGGAFAVRPITVVRGAFFAIAAADVDQDGDLDLALGAPTLLSSGQTVLLLNDGTGKFIDATRNLPVDTDYTNALAFGDVDRDGDVDLVIGNGGTRSAKQTRLYLNDGTGKFRDVTSSSMPADNDTTREVALGDVDGDGDLDLVIGNGLSARERNRLYLNDGRGRFADATSRLPSPASVTNHLAFSDLDRDGDLDLIEANGSTAGDRDRVYWNDGRGNFRDANSAISRRVEPSGALTIGDLDGDADPDVFIAGFEQRVYWNDGKGGLVESPNSTLYHPGNHGSAAIFDVDRDGDRDLMVFRSGPNCSLYVNRGKGELLDTREPLLPTYPQFIRAVAASLLADLNADRFPDLLLGNELFLNDGTGRMRFSAQLPVDLVRTIAASDFDGDGDVDLVVGRTGGDALLLNDGKGGFSAPTGRLPSRTGPSNSIVAADVDGDGDVDLAIATFQFKNGLLLNDGRGFFTDASGNLPNDADLTEGVVAADIDGDRDVDLVFANGFALFGTFRQQNRVYVNDGRGRFSDVTSTALPKHMDASNGVAIADVDHDGDVDLLFANSVASTDPREPSRLYLNRGNGTFASAPFPLARRAVRPAFVDLNNDGNSDVVVVGESQTPTPAVLLGNGRGAFTPAAGLIAGPKSIFFGTDLAVGDVDLDGDSDVVVHADLHVNRRTQIFARSLARLGRAFRLDVYSIPDRAIAIPLLGLRELVPPRDLGTLGLLRIDPAQMLLLPTLSLRDVQSVAVPLPAHPALHGRSLIVQALVASAQTTRLTNLIREPLVR